MAPRSKTWLILAGAVIVGATGFALADPGNELVGMLGGAGLGAGLVSGVTRIPGATRGGFDGATIAGSVLLGVGGGLIAVVVGEALGRGLGIVLALGVMAFLTGLLVLRAKG